MRRSFGGGGGGMGGGSGRGGSLLRTVQRAVRAGVGGGPPEPFSPSVNSNTIAGTNSRKPNQFSRKQSAAPNTALALNSSSSTNNSNNNDNGPSAFSSLVKIPVSAAAAWADCSSPTCSEELEWECVDGSEDERSRLFYEDLVFGTVPSNDEVQSAVSALQQVFEPLSSTQFSMENLSEDTGKDVGDEVGGQGDWVEPSWDLCPSRILQPHGSSNRVYDAFRLLQTEPSVQKMVMSLSSDKSVWDAVLNNEVVKELRSLLSQESSVGQRPDNNRGEGPDDVSGKSNPVKDILSWVFVNAKATVMQLIDKITKLVNEVFGKPPNDNVKKGGNVDPLEERLKTSLFLSIVVLLIVVVTRAGSA